MDRIEDDKKEQWIEMMVEPLPWQVSTKPTESQIADDSASFFSAMGQLQGGSDA